MQIPNMNVSAGYRRTSYISEMLTSPADTCYIIHNGLDFQRVRLLNKALLRVSSGPPSTPSPMPYHVGPLLWGMWRPGVVRRQERPARSASPFCFDRREFSPTSFFPSLPPHISFSSIFKPSANIRNLSTCRLELLYGLRIFPLHIVLLVDCLKYRVLLLSLFRATTYLLYFVICLPFPMN